MPTFESVIFQVFKIVKDINDKVNTYCCFYCLKVVISSIKVCAEFIGKFLSSVY